MGEIEFVLIDETLIGDKYPRFFSSYPASERDALVVLGESEDENLLGIAVLEILGLILARLSENLDP